MQMGSSSQYPYDYSLSQSPRESHWNTHSDPNGTIFEEGSSPQGYPPSQFSIQPGNNGVMGNQYMQDQISDQQLADMGQSLNLAGFVGPGLPFRGLDFIRNYNVNPSGYVMNEQDALWQSLDPGTFLDPDIPFTLGSDLPDGQDGPHWPGDGHQQ